MNLDTVSKVIGAIATAVAGLAAVGNRRSRRRTNIRADLEVLSELESHVDFGAGSLAHQALTNKIEFEVAFYSGVDLRSVRREIPWGSVIFAFLMGGGLAYWTAVLSESGFRWYAIFPGLVSVVLFVSIIGMLQTKVPNKPVGSTDDDSASGPPTSCR